MNHDDRIVHKRLSGSALDFWCRERREGEVASVGKVLGSSFELTTRQSLPFPKQERPRLLDVNNNQAFPPVRAVLASGSSRHTTQHVRTSRSVERSLYKNEMRYVENAYPLSLADENARLKRENAHLKLHLQGAYRINHALTTQMMLVRNAQE